MIKKIIILLLVSSLVGFVLFSIGFAGSFLVTYSRTPHLVDGPSGDVNNPQGERIDNGFRMLVLGDSLARGAGSQNDLGYSKYLSEHLSEIVDVAEYENQAINGLTSWRLLDLVSQEQIQVAIAEADLILLSIGGNDLRTLPIFQNVYTGDFNRVQTNYLNNLVEILEIIRNLNSDAIVAKLGLFNPFYDLIPDKSIEFLHRWNWETLQVIESNTDMVFIPAFDLFKYNPEFISYDMLHPNNEGYQAIAQRHLEVLRAPIERRTRE